MLVFVLQHQNFPNRRIFFDSASPVKRDSTHTIGVEFGSKVVQVGGNTVKLQIWVNFFFIVATSFTFECFTTITFNRILLVKRGLGWFLPKQFFGSRKKIHLSVSEYIVDGVVAITLKTSEKLN